VFKFVAAAAAGCRLQETACSRFPKFEIRTSPSLETFWLAKVSKNPNRKNCLLQQT
jgi:hypothetical protein